MSISTDHWQALREESIVISKDSHADDECQHNAHSKTRLSSEFGTPFTIFVALMIIMTMGMLMYGNTTVGAYVSVQVTPRLPFSSDVDLFEAVSPETKQHVTSWSQSQDNITLSDLANFLQHTVNSTESALEPVLLDIIDLIETLQAKYPYLSVDEDSLHNLTALLRDPAYGFSWHDLTATHKWNVFSFTLTSSIDDFWSAKAYPLALIIAIWSGAWPYVKLLLLLVIWLHPMKGPLRKKALVILDQLGKFSFIDLYVMIFMAVSFYITIAFTEFGVGVDMAIKVEIEQGVTLFAIMTLLSMFYSMLFLYFHEQQHLHRLNAAKRRHDEEKKQPLIISQSKDHDAVDAIHVVPVKVDQHNEPEFDHMDCFEIEVQRYSELHRWKSTNSFKIYAFYDAPRSLCGLLWRVVFLMVCIANIVLCFEMLWTAPVRYDIEGLAGWAMGDNIRSSSVIGTVNALPSSTDSVPAAWFCVVQYYMTVIAAPIIVSLVIVMVWLCPLNYKMHNVICHLLFPLQAWNAVDVFLVGTIAASVELEQVSEWILNTNYAKLCGDGGIFQKFLGAGCFSVAGHLTYGSILIGVFVVVQWSALLYTRRHIKLMHQRLSKMKIHSLQV